MSDYTPVGKRKAAEILAFPALKAIPAPSYPLKGPAYEKYLEIAKGLLDAGKLNVHTKALCEQIGIIHGEIHKRLEFGQQVSTKQFERLDKALAQLDLVGQSNATAPDKAASEQENRFSRYGIILRRGTQEATVRPS